MPIIGFSNVHIGGDRDGEPYTNEEVIAYVIAKYGTAPSSIVHTGGCIRVTIPGSDSDELDIMSFDEWMRHTHGDPQPGDAHYDIRQRFGYSVWLIKVHPEVFAAAGCTKTQIYEGQRLLYNWYCVDAAASNTRLDPPESDEDALGAFLEGTDIVEVTRKLTVCGEIELAPGARGVALWDEQPTGVSKPTGVFCMFEDGDDGLVPVVCGNGDVRATKDVFTGWDAL